MKIQNSKYVINGKLTQKFIERFAKFGGFYECLARSGLIPETFPYQFRLNDVYIVGSVLKGFDDGDLDLVIVPRDLSDEGARLAEVNLAKVLFCNREKSLATHVLVKPKGPFDPNNSYKVSNQLRSEINVLNDRITRKQ